MPSGRETQYRRVILIRHGESTANEKRLLTGRNDPDLTAHGMNQAKAAARLVHRQSLQVDTLYSSPLKRALHTARFIARREHVNTQESELLLETHFGSWEGMTRGELIQKPLWSSYIQDPFHFQFPEGESPQDVRRRTEHFLDTLREDKGWSTAVVVTHYTPIVFFILNVLGLEGGRRAPFAVDNASLTLVRMSDESMYIEKLNCSPC
jgi:broad specificity phosphatase PhoE